MPVHHTIGLHVFLSALSLLSFTAQAAEPPRLEITGDYRYKVHEYESMADAKNLACREAFRLAVVNSAMYSEQTAMVVDSALLRDMAYNLTTSIVDQQLLQHVK